MTKTAPKHTYLPGCLDYSSQVNPCAPDRQNQYTNRDVTGCEISGGSIDSLKGGTKVGFQRGLYLFIFPRSRGISSSIFIDYKSYIYSQYNILLEIKGIN